MKTNNSSCYSLKLVKTVAIITASISTFSVANANEINVQQYQFHNMLGSITTSNTSTIGSSMGLAEVHKDAPNIVSLDDQSDYEQYFVATENSDIVTGAEQSVIINDVTIAASDWIVTKGNPDIHLTISDSFGSINSPNGDLIVALNNADVQETVMERVYTVPNGIYSVSTSLLANYVTTEYPEWVGSEFNDTVQINVITGSGNEYLIDTPFRQELNSAELTAVSGLPTPLLKPYNDDGVNLPLNSGGQTGFLPVSLNNIPVAGGGEITIRVTSENVGDELFPSAILVTENN